MDRKRIEADVEAVLPALTRACRAADRLFESGATGGGGTRHWIRDCLVGALQDEGLTIIPVAALAEAEAEIARLRRDAEMGPTPHKCLNSDCKTISYGTGYASCPGCGGTEGMESLASRPGEGAA